jgi:hypothetical protein
MMRLSYSIVDFHVHLKPLPPAGQKSSLPSLNLPSLTLPDLSPLFDPISRQLAGQGLLLSDPYARFLYRTVSRYAQQTWTPAPLDVQLRELTTVMARQGVRHSILCPLSAHLANGNYQGDIYSKDMSLFLALNIADLKKEKLPDSTAGIRGLSVHLPATEAYQLELENWLDEAQVRDWPVMIHLNSTPSMPNTSSDLPYLKSIVKRFPKLPLIIAHMGGDHCDALLNLLEPFHNVICETSWQPARQIRKAVDRWGAQRVIYGSDYPLLPAQSSLEQVMSALNNTELRLVLQDNARRLLGV